MPTATVWDSFATHFAVQRVQFQRSIFSCICEIRVTFWKRCKWFSLSERIGEGNSFLASAMHSAKNIEDEAQVPPGADLSRSQNKKHIFETSMSPPLVQYDFFREKSICPKVISYKCTMCVRCCQYELTWTIAAVQDLVVEKLRSDFRVFMDQLSGIF